MWEDEEKSSDVDGAYGDSQEGIPRRGVLAWPCYSATPLACVGESRVALDCLSSGWKGACQILTKHQTVTEVKTAHETVRNSQPKGVIYHPLARLLA